MDIEIVEKCIQRTFEFEMSDVEIVHDAADDDNDGNDHEHNGPIGKISS